MNESKNPGMRKNAIFSRNYTIIMKMMILQMNHSRMKMYSKEKLIEIQAGLKKAAMNGNRVSLRYYDKLRKAETETQKNEVMNEFHREIRELLDFGDEIAAIVKNRIGG